MMNMLLVLIALVAFTYFGGQNVPKILKDNKQIILGVLVGVLLHHVLRDRVDGFCSLKTKARSTLDKRNDANPEDPICGKTRRDQLFVDTGYCTRQMQEKCDNYGGVLASPPNPNIPLPPAPANETTEERDKRIETNKKDNCEAVFNSPSGSNNDMQHVCDYRSPYGQGDPCVVDPFNPEGGLSAWDLGSNESDCTCPQKKLSYRDLKTNVTKFRCKVSK